MSLGSVHTWVFWTVSDTALSANLLISLVVHRINLNVYWATGSSDISSGVIHSRYDHSIWSCGDIIQDFVTSFSTSDPHILSIASIAAFIEYNTALFQFWVNFQSSHFLQTADTSLEAKLFILNQSGFHSAIAIFAYNCSKNCSINSELG